jgi:hypothetical protein
MAYLDKLRTMTRDQRLNDPDVQIALDAEWKRVRKSFNNLGRQSKETTVALLYNSLRTFIPRKEKTKKKGEKHEPDYLKNAVERTVDSGAAMVALVGRILLSTGRATKYGVRRGLAI